MLGQGGMGRVYRATDTSDGSTVAVKILHDHLGANSNVVKRLHREARLLAKIANPFIVNLLELNRDGDQHYLVMEFVNGVSLDSILKDQQICPDGKVPEAFAVAIGTEMALALADAHRQDIIHRDVKPHNIMLVRGSQWYAKIHGQSVVTSPVTGSAKLCDFGLARMMTPTDSDHLTRSGAVLGTPWYMAPEQALGRPDVGPQADVYSLGATLFHLLAGRPPFLADSSTAMTLKHVNERAPALRQFNSAISEPLCRIIEKCLAKRPEDRFRDAADLYEELARLQRGEPTRFIAHPRLPPTVGQVHEYLWTWEMQAPAEAIWPHVANTERFNRATGIPPVEFHSQSYPTANTSKLLPEVRRFGRLRVKGLTLDWREHPFEWIEGQRHSVLREYTHGPVRWLISSVELTPRADGGCTLTHHLRFEPRHFLGRMVAALEVGWKARRAFDRVYRRIDAFAQGADIPDPFELPPVMTRQQRHRMNHIIDQMATIVPYTVLETLADYLTQGSSQDIARIKPLELARQLNLDPEHLIPAFLHGARLGLFMMLWDVLCPRCRTSASFAETLRSLAQHSHCPACQFDFPLDFTQSVELVFRVHPQIRACETRTYCVGGPAHFPHIVAQIRVGSQECFRLHLNLSPGTYRITGPQFAQSWDFDVLSNRGVVSWQLLLPDDLVSIPHSSYTHQPKVSFRARKQELLITNQHDQELLIRVERTVNRTDALTPARLSSIPLFRQLFPSEVLRSGQLLSLSTLTFLAIDFHVDSQIHDTQGNTLEPQQGRAIRLIYDFFQFARETAPKYGGLVVKSLGERLLMVFDQKLQALRTALELRRRTQQPEKPDNTRARQYVRMGIHSGPAVLMTINDQMEYFGPTLTQTWQMPDRLHRGQIGLSFALASDPHIDEFLRGENLPTKLVDGSTANGTPYLVL
jgi:serine/threonine protein kinase